MLLCYYFNSFKFKIMDRFSTFEVVVFEFLIRCKMIICIICSMGYGQKPKKGIMHRSTMNM